MCRFPCSLWLAHRSVGGPELVLQLREIIRSTRGRKCRNSSGTGLKEEEKGRFVRDPCQVFFFPSFFLPYSSDSRFHSNTTGALRDCGIVGYHHGLVFMLPEHLKCWKTAGCWFFCGLLCIVKKQKCSFKPPALGWKELRIRISVGRSSPCSRERELQANHPTWPGFCVRGWD